MKRRMIFALLACAATSFAASPATIQAQTPPTSFVSYDNVPFGPGDRAMKLSIQLAAGETNANTELWVLYGQDRAAVTSAGLGGRVAQARVRLDTVSGAGVASGTFIFPHSDNGRPNMTDTNPATISSGRTVHYKLVKTRGATDCSATPNIMQ